MLCLACHRWEARRECREQPTSLWSPVPDFIMCQLGHLPGTEPLAPKEAEGLTGLTGMSSFTADTNSMISPKRAD